MTTTFSGAALRYGIFGGSHEPCIGVEAEGLPAGEAVDLDELSAFLRRRAPGQNAWSTPRKEADAPEFTSGLDESGRLTGGILRAVIYNTNTRSGDYALDVPRPSHADYPAHVKYGGAVNMAGGGPFSGRMTAPLCVLGGICKQVLARRGITIGAHLVQIGSVAAPGFDPVSAAPEAVTAAGKLEFPCGDEAASLAMQAEIADARAEEDSVGGVIECCALGLPVGLGGPMTDGLESRVAAIVFGIPAVRGVEFGAGFAAAALRGSAHNDPYIIKDGKIVTGTNRHGGVLGGISTGMPLLFRAAFKPTPSIGRAQKSVSLSRMEPTELKISGRHDPCVVPRAVPVVEAACAVALLDALLETESLSL